jgi:pimeloyl-ACP methyl ester carboxylesterase
LVLENWQPRELAAIAHKLGIPAEDLSRPSSLAFRSSDGLRLRAIDWGGDGPPVVLLHGGALSARTWDCVALGLRGQFRLIAPDLRGHGSSGWAETYSIERCVEDVDALLRQFALERVHVVGMSLGGLIAAEWAASSTQRVLSLTLIDIAPGSNFAASAKMREFVNQFPGAPDVEAAVQMALRVNPRSDPERLRYRFGELLRRDDSGNWVWKRDARRVADYPEIVRRVESLADKAAHIHAPFLMVRGERSKILDEAAAEGFAARFRQGFCSYVSDAGHNVQEDNPRELIDVLREFWTTHAAQLRDA